MTKKIFEFNGSADLYQLLIGTPEIIKQIISEAGGKSGRVEIVCDEQLYVMGPITTEVINEKAFGWPYYAKDDLRFGEVANLQFEGADEMMGQKYPRHGSYLNVNGYKMRLRSLSEHQLAGSYRESEYMGPRPPELYRPDLTSEEIAMLEAIDGKNEPDVIGS